MRILIANLICLLLVVKPSLQLIDTKADVLFILDMSGSVGKDNFQTVKNTAANIAGQFTISKTHTQVGVDVFSSNVKTEIKLRSLNLIQLLKHFIKQIPYVGGGTKTYDALDHARKSSFTKKNGDRAGIQNIALVMTDGGSDNQKRTCEAARSKIFWCIEKTVVQAKHCKNDFESDKPRLGMKDKGWYRSPFKK
ncbi:Hypothetical predicted protein [Mytilus galloprovincialis]|uniref:VWFA domain-containing protein n=1 Tax=Mytilus galloprovincialis TaxID=29158 RepID=A0A8B6F6A9_MYTGA|nr:Hypothetical predicted protein [Mytilus galloprovincialis]